jgi:hypothetical protein
MGGLRRVDLRSFCVLRDAIAQGTKATTLFDRCFDRHHDNWTLLTCGCLLYATAVVTL